MRCKKRYEVMDVLVMIFLAIFALPFLGAYYMLHKDIETKIIGGILCVVGLVIWFLFGVH